MKKIFVVLALALAVTAGLAALNVTTGNPEAAACEGSNC